MRSIIITSLLFLCYSQILFSATIYVNKAIAGGLENGSSWANAFTNLQDAIDAASAGDEIWVVAGTYVPTKDKMGVANVNDRSNTFYITKNIKIYGGFVGTETLLSQRNYETNITILSGDMDNDADNSDNAYHLIYIDGTTANGNITNTMILDGFTIQKGNANGGGDNNNGGGILINGKGAGKAASPTISNCKFKDNTAENGGAMYNYGNLSGTSNPICINVTFSSNRATFGGAIYNNGDGSQCNPTFNKCTFVNNFGTNYGGVIFHYGYGSTSTPTFTACNFTANTTSGYGGVLYINSYFGDCKPTFTNCLFSGNIAQEGGVLANDASFYGKSTVEITNCTFYNNNATGSAYDLISNWGSTNTTNIKNSILWDGTAINTAGGTTTINYCIFDDGIPDGSVALPSGSTGSNNLDSDPLFTDKVNNDFSLQSSSPAKNTGTNSDAPSTDITGANRSDGLIDIGAMNTAQYFLLN
jgi:predicted outer membrane repeat protein